MANTFKIGERVKTKSGSRTGGTVFRIACALATAAGGKLCASKTCAHPTKDYVWVIWPGQSHSFSYPYTDLDPDSDANTTSPENKDDKVEIKDEYIEKAKQAINNLTTDKPTTEFNKDFWRAYNGFDRVKYDRSGKPFLHETKADDEKPPLKNEEISWDKYHGFVRSKTYRKDT